MPNWLQARSDRLVGIVFLIVGGLLVWLGYRGIAKSPYIVDQLAYLVSGGIGGLCSLVIGGGGIVFADVRDACEKVDQVDRLVRADSVVGRMQKSGALGEEGGGQVIDRLWRHGLPWFVRRAYFGMAIGGVAGGVVVGIGWEMTASTVKVEEGLEGVMVGVAGLLWVSVMMFGMTWALGRVFASKKRKVAQGLEWMIQSRRVVVRRESEVEEEKREKAKWVMSEGSELFHSADCPTVPYLKRGGKWVEEGEVPVGKVRCQLCMGAEGSGWRERRGERLRGEVCSRG